MQEYRRQRIAEIEQSDTAAQLQKVEERMQEMVEKKRCMEEQVKQREELVQQVQALEQGRAVAQKEMEQDHVELGDVCPTCRQSVSEEQRERIEEGRQKQESIIRAKIKKMESAVQQRKAQLRSLPSDEERTAVIAKWSALQQSMQHLKEQVKREEVQAQEKVRLAEELKKIRKDLEELDIERAEKSLAKAQQEFRDLRERYDRYAKYEIEAARRTEQQSRKESMEKHLADRQNELRQKQTMLQILKEATKDADDVKQQERQAKRRLEERRAGLEEAKVAHATLLEKRRNLEHQLAAVNGHLLRRREIKKKAAAIAAFMDWTKQRFLPLMDTIEQHVFLSVYHEFNELFTTWFAMLIEDESIQARLDAEFSPIVEQDGYEIDVANLSGGERTCVALAYRLALNKVVNDIIETVHTKDILILDEPTDGFSTDQLDRVRAVLDELNVAQLIIVSHEPKIETFVEHIMRITKQNHESVVI